MSEGGSPSRMVPRKRLVCCFDGTWKTADREDESSNVVRLMRAIAPSGLDGVPQVKFYDKGVGTGNLLDRFRGGAFGRYLDGCGLRSRARRR